MRNPASEVRPLQLLCVQLGFHPAYPDVSTLATTYNDGLYYVASFLKRELTGSSVELCQMFWGEDPSSFPLEDYDYILISALATHFWSNLPALEAIRARRGPRAKIIMGGPHATFAPHEALQYADYVILGEGEIPTLQLILALESGGDLGQVENLCCIGAGGALEINRFARYGDLDNAIDPALLRRAPRLHWATLSMSRGCPFDCYFCYAIRILGRRFRPKSIDTIRREIAGIHGQTGCTRFYVTDLNFTTRADFCAQVADTFTGQDYRFIAMSRIELADDLDLLLRLRRAGFGEYCLGVESEDPGVLRAFNKKVMASEQTARLHRFAENDVYIHSAIIFGLEAQDRAAILRTAAWCADARIVHPTFVCLAEYPYQVELFGSRQDVENHRIIQGVPTYQHYSFVGIFPRHMRPSELQRAILDSYGVFFARAFEIEQRPQRRMRLKAYARSVEQGRAGMERHIAFLSELERPYYTSGGMLKEDLLKADFAARHGEILTWLGGTRREAQFVKAFSV